MKLVRLKDLRGPFIAADTETTGLRVWHGDEPYLFGFYDSHQNFAAVEWVVNPFTRKVLSNHKDLKELKRLFARTDIEWIFHNAKYDVRIMQNAFQIEIAGKIHDTMFMAHFVCSNEPTYKLKTLASKYLGMGSSEKDALHKITIKYRKEAKKRGWKIGETRTQNVRGEWETKAAVETDYWLARSFEKKNQMAKKYCLKDVKMTMTLFEFYKIGLDDTDQWHEYLREMDLWPVTYAMETRGVRINYERIKRETKKFRVKAFEQLKIVQDAAGDINIDSPKQLREFVYGEDGLDLPVIHTTPTGLPSTSADSLREYLDNPTIKALFTYRAMKNGLINFFHKFRDFRVQDPLVDDGGWALHPDYQQIGPKTGRYSCRTPNLQNAANDKTSRSPVPIQVRSPFGPRPGYEWYPVDYSQVEARIFADVAQEPFMLEAIKQGRDIHTESANKVWGGEGNEAGLRAARKALNLTNSGWETEADDWLSKFDYDIVKAEASLGLKTSRSTGKQLNFLKIYGGGVNAVMDLIGCSREEAFSLIRDYDNAFPRIREYSKELAEEALRNGFIVNKFERRLYVDRDMSYAAVNYMIQGSAAELMKQSMRKCAEYLEESGKDAHIVMTIHDELVFEIKREHCTRKLLRDLCRLMEDHEGHFNVPTPVDIDRVDERWDHKVPAKIGRW